jgi:hypothetical protein
MSFTDQDVSIRLAQRDEQAMLESLQRRASLNNPGDRDAILAHPDAITPTRSPCGGGSSPSSEP